MWLRRPRFARATPQSPLAKRAASVSRYYGITALRACGGRFGILGLRDYGITTVEISKFRNFESAGLPPRTPAPAVPFSKGCASSPIILQNPCNPCSPTQAELGARLAKGDCGVLSRRSGAKTEARVAGVVATSHFAQSAFGESQPRSKSSLSCVRQHAHQTSKLLSF